MPTCARNSISGCRRSTAIPAPTARWNRSFNNFTGSVQSLVTSPDSTAARSLVLSNAQVLAQTLNGMTTDIQALRGDAESGLADSVAAANDALQKIAELNTQLAGSRRHQRLRCGAGGSARPLSSISCPVDGHPGRHRQPNQVSVFTNSGVQLVGSGAAQLSFNPQGTVSATTQWNADPTKSNLGTLMLVSPNGSDGRSDRQQSIRSGQDRRLSRHARQRAGAGAEPARQPGRDDGAGAVERHHRRNRRQLRRRRPDLPSIPPGC